MSLRRVARLFSLAAFSIVFAAPISQAQITDVTDDQSTPHPGAGHNYIQALNETVNPANGSVSLRLPVQMPKGRGLTVPFGFAYDSNGVWHLTGDGANDGGAVWISNQTFLSQGGWAYSVPSLSLDQFSAPWFNGGGTCIFTSNYVLQDPSGGRHGLGLSFATDQQGGDGSACGLSTVTSGGDDFYKATLSPTRVSAWDGTVYDFSASSWHTSYGTYQAALPTSIEDRNGNKVIINDGGGAFSYTDTVGRTVLSANFSSVSISGLTNPYSLTWATAASSYSVQSLFLDPPAACNPPPRVSGSQTVLSNISLPNGKSYHFYYDSTYGLLNKIVYPTGGYVRYTWSLNSLSDAGQYDAACANTGGSCNPPVLCQYRFDTPAVTDRYVSFDGTNEVLHQHFTYSTNWASGSVYWNTKQTTVTTYDLIRGGSFQTSYTYAPSGCGAPDPPNVDTHIATQCPVEQTIVYHDWSGATLQTVSKTWQDVNMLTSQQITLDNGATSKTTYSYLNNNSIALITEKDEYDFGASSPARKILTTYQTFSGTPGFLADRPCKVLTQTGSGTTFAETDYLYDGGTTVCGTPGTSATTSVTNLPAGTHDETLFGPSSPTSRGNATKTINKCLQSCTDSTTSYTYDETGQTLTRVDACGNATCSDMSGTNHTTTHSYANNFDSNPSSNANAYLTQITDPLGHTSSFKYAYSDGQLISSTDQNSKVTSYQYNDSLRRITETDYADGGKTTVSYNDTAPSPSVTTTRLITTTPSTINLSTTTLMDGMGHVTQTQLTTDPDGTTYTDATFDGFGRVRTQSNPHRSTSATTDGTTTNYFDALGRICLAVPPDGTLPTGSSCPTTQPSNTIWTTYLGNCTTVTDQAGKSRTSCVDGSDRLTQVLEDPGTSPHLNYETDYQYDVLNNLLCVAQKGTNGGTFSNCASTPATWRPRTFTYDSLSRLLTAINPESGSSSYVYDANGNLSTKTSPKPNQTGSATVVATYTYDALNRLTQKSFNDGPPATPTVKYVYDGNAAPSGCTFPSLTITNPIGRRTGMCDSPGSEAWAYDSMGRVLFDQRKTNGITKQFAYTYNLDGSLNAHTYPSINPADVWPTHTMPLTNTQGGAGRSVSLYNTTVGIAYNVKYTPAGAVCFMNSAWGNSFTERYTFNNRLQPVAMQVYGTGFGTNPANSCGASTDTSGTQLNLAYNFVDASSHNNGNVVSITNNVYSPRSQSFTYDSLNRLKTAKTNATHATDAVTCWAETYNYDPWGNLLRLYTDTTNQSAYVGCTGEGGFDFTNFTGSNNRITTSGYGYDAAGNLTTNPGVGTQAFDAENHLVSAGGQSYAYDGDGNRIWKAPVATPTSPTLIYWYGGSGNLLQESDGAGIGQYTHIYFNGRRIKRVEWTHGGWFDHYAYDHLGNARWVYGYNGAADLSEYYPFGGERPITSAEGNKFKFTGKERDSESGLDYFVARFDSSVLARFISADPENAGAIDGDPQSWNAYAYVRNNPLNLTDPDGRNYLVCQTVITAGSKEGGATPATTCADLSNEEYQQFLKDNPNLRVFGGNIYAVNENGHWTKIGSEEYYNEEDVKAAKMLVSTGKTLGDPRTIAGWYLLSALGGYGLYYAGAFEGGLTTLEIGTEVGAEVTPSAGQTAQISRQLAQQGRKSLEKSLRTLEKRLAEHEAKLQEIKQAGGHTSSVESEINNFRRLIQAIKTALGK